MHPGTDAPLYPRVTFVVRPDILERRGGDGVQVLNTKRELELLGCHVDVITGPEDRDAAAALDGADIIHCFNLLLAHQQRWLLDVPRKAGRRMVLSPIFWDTTAYERRSGAVPAWKRLLLRALCPLPLTPVRLALRDRLKSVAYNRVYRNELAGWLRRFDVLLPNSEAEAAQLRSMFDATAPAHVVPNACDAPPDVDARRDDRMPDRYILCVGRVERRKNQLRLVEAASVFRIPVVLIGNVNPDEPGYWRRVRDRARSLRLPLLHEPHMPHEAVWRWYRNATMHAQPSWFETPGLSSLEAVAAECPAVCTGIGSTREYFLDDAEYCLPDNVASIRQALGRAMGRRAAGGLAPAAARIRERYTWRRAGEETLAAYQAALQAAQVA